jgi:hypothetical protein
MLPREIITVAIVTSIESRVADRGGSRVLASNRPCRQGFSATEGLRRGVLSESSGEGSTAHDEVKRPSEGYWERIKEEDSRAAGGANFYRR